MYLTARGLLNTSPHVTDDGVQVRSSPYSRVNEEAGGQSGSPEQVNVRFLAAGGRARPTEPTPDIFGLEFVASVWFSIARCGSACPRRAHLPLSTRNTRLTALLRSGRRPGRGSDFGCRRLWNTGHVPTIAKMSQPPCLY